jgi:hypothetical protein
MNPFINRTDFSFLNRIPKLSSGTSLEPYVRQGDEIATVDSAQLVDPKQKELANSIHLIKQAKTPSKVCSPLSSAFPWSTRPTYPNCYEENFPNA